KRTAGTRAVTLSVQEKFNVLTPGAKTSIVTLNLDAELTEQVGPVDANGKSVMHLGVIRFSPPVLEVPDELIADKKDKQKIEEESRRGYKDAEHLELKMILNERGDVEQSNAVAKTAPQNTKAQVESLGDNLLQWHQVLSVPLLPNRQVTY